MKILVLLMWLNNLLYAFQNTKKHIVFLMFNLTFFTFLLGKIASQFFATDKLLRTNLIDTFNITTQSHVYLSLFLSLISLFYGYIYFVRKKGNGFEKKLDYDSAAIRNLRKYSRSFMYFFFVFALAVNFEKMYFVLSTSYIAYYTDFHSFLPNIVNKFSACYTLSFYLYLTTMPKKEDARWPIYLFILLGLSALGYGQRNGFMLNAVIVIIYYYIRQKIKIYGASEIWVTRKKIIIGLVISPFLFTFLTAFNNIRSKEAYSLGGNLTNNTLKFFHEQSNSIALIGYEKVLHHEFPKGIPYSLGCFVDRFTHIEFLSPFFPHYAPKSYELAMYGHNFSETITYLQNPDLYFAGGGLGGCYIAEIYHDFGYAGIILINLLYAFILARVISYSQKSIWALYCALIILDRVLYAPRADSLGCFTEFLSSAFILYTALMYYLSKTKKVKKAIAA